MHLLVPNVNAFTYFLKKKIGKLPSRFLEMFQTIEYVRLVEFVYLLTKKPMQ